MCDINQAFQLLLSPSISNTNSSTYYSYEYENEQQAQEEEKRQHLLCQLQNSYEQQYQNVKKEGFKSICTVRRNYDDDDDNDDDMYNCFSSFSFKKWDIHTLFIIILGCTFINTLLILLMLFR